MTRTIIIDDEIKARETIVEMMKIYCKNVIIVAQAQDVKSGISAIKQYKPDLILLDIKLPDGSGFDLLKKLDIIDFKIIFITAYEQYAIKAFRFSALDYLLKPIDPEELINAVEKVDKSIGNDNLNLKLDAFLSNIPNISKEVKKIVLKTSDNIYLVDVQDIIRCESDRNYTMFYLVNGEKIIVSRTLKEFDELLNKYNFFRVHQSHIINLRYVVRYEKRNKNCVVMKDNSKIPVSFRKKNELLKIFKTL